MNNYINEIINTKIDFLKSSFNINKTVNHQGIKGSLNEILFLELIKDLIPLKYKLTKGIVQDCKGNQSNESDIILYDNEILPAILFGAELGFIPCEAIEYTFEIKSTLTSSEIDTTIIKFNNLRKCVGYKGRNVLFSFSTDIKNKSELKRYFEKDEISFLFKPSISIICVQDRGYYFFDKRKIYLKELMNKNEFAEISYNQNKNKIDFKINDLKLHTNSEVKFDIDKKLIINNIDYEDIYFTIYTWLGTEDSKNNCNLLGLLSGISNTLCKEKFGKYLLSTCDESNWNRYSEYIVDMWNNESYKKIEFNGFKDSILNSFKFSLSLTEDTETNKLIIYEGNKDATKN